MAAQVIATIATLPSGNAITNAPTKREKDRHHKKPEWYRHTPHHRLFYGDVPLVDTACPFDHSRIGIGGTDDQNRSPWMLRRRRQILGLPNPIAKIDVQHPRDDRQCKYQQDSLRAGHEQHPTALLAKQCRGNCGWSGRRLIAASLRAPTSNPRQP